MYGTKDESQDRCGAAENAQTTRNVSSDPEAISASTRGARSFVGSGSTAYTDSHRLREIVVNGWERDELDPSTAMALRIYIDSGNPQSLHGTRYQVIRETILKSRTE